MKMEESFEQKRKRAQKIFKRLQKTYPDAGIVLNYKTPIQLLAAVILSAQATDVQVNKLTDKLFKKYKTVDDFANANLRIFTHEVSGVNFYKNKAKFIVGAARLVREEYGGKLPRDIKEMIKLPGVARKTANIVLQNAYGIVQGIAVDTHVKRVSKKLLLTESADPVKIEQDLMRLFYKIQWGRVGYLLQAYGRTASLARGKAKIKDPLEGLY
jgi:endonuclease-3